MLPLTLAIALAGALFQSGPAGGPPPTGPASDTAPPPQFLIPTSFTAPATAPLDLQMRQSPAADAPQLAWPADRCQWFFARSAGEQQNLQALAPLGRPEPRVQIGRQDATVIGLDLRPTIVTAPAAAIARLAKTADTVGEPDAAEVANTASVRVRHYVSAKSIIRPAGARRTPSATVMSKTGQPAEIRLLADPTALTLGSDLPIRVYVHGDKAGGVTVTALHVPTGRSQQAVSDRGGMGRFQIDAGGAWLLSFQSARPSQPDSDAAWDLFSGTVAFEVPELGDAPAGEDDR